MPVQMFQEQSSLQLEKLNEENAALRSRLRDVALSDNEKQELLQRHHNSAPASIATNVGVVLGVFRGGLVSGCLVCSCWTRVPVAI